MVKIETHDQEGGTNIGQVNVGNNQPQGEEKGVPRWLKIAGLLVAMAAGVATVLTFIYS